jgi:hypothetical protein
MDQKLAVGIFALPARRGGKRFGVRRRDAAFPIRVIHVIRWSKFVFIRAD